MLLYFSTHSPEDLKKCKIDNKFKKKIVSYRIYYIFVNKLPVCNNFNKLISLLVMI